MSSAAPLAAPLVETTEDRLPRELSQSSQAEARESLLREECARLRADNRALKRADRLVEYRSHVDRRRRDLGYESPHHDG